jgi:hypothetical protein
VAAGAAACRLAGFAVGFEPLVCALGWLLWWPAWRRAGWPVSLSGLTRWCVRWVGCCGGRRGGLPVSLFGLEFDLLVCALGGRRVGLVVGWISALRANPPVRVLGAASRWAGG